MDGSDEAYERAQRARYRKRLAAGDPKLLACIAQGVRLEACRAASRVPGLDVRRKSVEGPKVVTTPAPPDPEE